MNASSRLVSGALLVCCLLPAFAASAAEPARASRAAPAKVLSAPEQARQYLRSGRVVEAADSLRAHLQLQPQDLDSRRLLLQLLLDGGHHIEAEAQLSEALALQPDVPDLRRLQASLLARRGEAALALASLHRSASFGQHAGDLAFAGQLALQVGQPEAAREHFEQALRLGPVLPRWQLALAGVRLSLGDKAGARALLEAIPAESLADYADSSYAKQLMAAARLTD
ncbi:tetratricopeptide repeat protein [Uliginosibacterium sp. TH139]|uniref:tetratricopeptide repeat protein n=1 Tax=Uliginosibacterium sp. TH139 TaxID=2067453 RepID=UPI000C79BB08|nr:tetratricopeptide repeat protein [Uliginosibacterium sp. TH139]PLK48600.1 hypothetical protein C0V76_11090 [Uliginosibacterium sp. TH139]